MENYINNINNTVETYCRLHKINITSFCEKLGFSPAYFSALKGRGTTFSINDLGKVADYMGISVSQLIQGQLVPREKIYEQIPYISQKISAGSGEPEIESDITTVLVPKNLLKINNPENIYAATVKGDSMIGANLYSGDTVCFKKNYIEGDGIYVIYYLNEYYVKRLQFNPFENKVLIISENPKYKTFEINADNENLIIVGKVIGWIHTE